MSRASLDGAGVLVTRPAHLADALVLAVNEAGGRAIRFPVIDIAGRDAATVAREAHALPAADIVVFVSQNAVQHGRGTLAGNDARVAAIGPATAAALARAGIDVEIVPEPGYDSEALLASPAFADVAGRRIRIVRGDSGRELLGRTLRERGADVSYLAVYRRERHRYERQELDDIARRVQHGDVRFITAMSVASLQFLLDLLPAACFDAPGVVRLVTPSDRVIQTALERIPTVRALRAAGPDASSMLAAMMAHLRPQTDNAHD